MLSSSFHLTAKVLIVPNLRPNKKNKKQQLSISGYVAARKGCGESRDVTVPVIPRLHDEASLTSWLDELA